MLKNAKLGANAVKRVAAGAHFPSPWLFVPPKRPDDRADYCQSQKSESVRIRNKSRTSGSDMTATFTQYSPRNNLS